MEACADVEIHSFGNGNTVTSWLLRSIFEIAAWYIIESQTLPSGSNSRLSPPLGCSGRTTGIAMSLVFPVLGSITPTNWAPKSEYQTCPSLSTTTSCGSASLRGRSYSVTTTLVERPLGRGNVLSGYSIASELPSVTFARNSAAALAASPVTTGRSPRGPGSSGCGWVGVLPGEYRDMRRNTCSNSAGLWVDIITRCKVWQATHIGREGLCLFLRGTVTTHS